MMELSPLMTLPVLMTDILIVGLMKIKKLILSSVVMMTVMLFTSCKHYVCDKYYYFEEGWIIEDTLWYNFDIDDTDARYKVKFNLRVSDEYKYRNMFLFTKTIFPDNVQKIDTLQFILSDEEGNSYGKGMSVNKELEFVIDEAAQFVQHGHYSLEVLQGMRDNPLEGVNSLGFVITQN